MAIIRAQEIRKDDRQRHRDELKRAGSSGQLRNEMITGFSIENFKSLARLPEAEGNQLPFGPINVLIGPNGCGKSSLLQAIDFLRAFFRSSVELYLDEHHWEYNDLPN